MLLRRLTLPVPRPYNRDAFICWGPSGVALNKLFVVALLAGAAYFSIAYWPVGETYFAVRYAAQEIASKRARSYSERRDVISDAMSEVERKTGLVVFTSDVDYEVDDRGRRHVSVDVVIPVRFPFVGTENEHEFTITASGVRQYGATQ